MALGTLSSPASKSCLLPNPYMQFLIILLVQWDHLSYVTWISTDSTEASKTCDSLSRSCDRADTRLWSHECCIRTGRYAHVAASRSNRYNAPQGKQIRKCSPYLLPTRGATYCLESLLSLASPEIHYFHETLLLIGVFLSVHYWNTFTLISRYTTNLLILFIIFIYGAGVEPSLLLLRTFIGL
jgi:hypothetical protein